MHVATSLLRCGGLSDRLPEIQSSAFAALHTSTHDSTMDTLWNCAQADSDRASSLTKMVHVSRRPCPIKGRRTSLLTSRHELDQSRPPIFSCANSRNVTRLTHKASMHDPTLKSFYPIRQGTKQLKLHSNFNLWKRQHSLLRERRRESEQIAQIRRIVALGVRNKQWALALRRRCRRGTAV